MQLASRQIKGENKKLIGNLILPGFPIYLRKRQSYTLQYAILPELFGSFQHPWRFNRPNHKERPQIQHFGTFSMHLNQRFLITCQGIRSVAGDPTPANSGLDLNRPIRSRISRKSVLGTTTSAIWNTTYRECLTTLAPILISFSRSVLSDHIFTDLGNARRRKKLPRL
jgi:hypothetical protein